MIARKMAALVGAGMVSVAVPAETTEVDSFTSELPAAISPETKNVCDQTLTYNDAASTVRTAKLGLGVPLSSALALAGEQTWRESPASANWNSTDLNWDAGAAWTPNSKAIFGNSSVKAITVKEKVTASELVFTVDGYTFAGPHDNTGLNLASATPTAGEQVSIPVEVADGASVFFNTYLKMYSMDAFYKKGAGTATLSDGYNGLQLISHQGDLRLTGGTVTTAKIYKDSAAEPASLHLDNVTLIPWNANKLIGHPNRFDTATIGAKGFTINAAYDVELHQCFSTAPGTAADGGIRKTGVKQLLVAPQGGEKSTFAGGITVSEGELAVANADGLGTGGVTVKSGAGVAVQDAALNQAGSYKLEKGGVFGAVLSNYTVDRPGELPAFADSNFRNILGLGRTGSLASALTLAPANDVRLGGVNLSGTLDLTLGGTLKVGDTVGDRFFGTANRKSGSSVQVAADGLTVDVPEGVSTDFGMPLVAETHNVIQASTATDGFESGNDGWSLKQNSSADGAPARSNNGGSFIKNADYYTTDGSYFIYLRRKNYMEKSITVPSDGQWRVVFRAGCRPGYESYKLTITVTLGSNTHTIAARSSDHGFQEFETPAYALTAGAKTVRITLGDGKQWSGMGIDCVRLERVGDVPAPFVKTGAGELALTDFASGDDVTVSGGTLAMADATLNGARVTVANGATLALGKVRLDGARVTVPAGATLALRPMGANLVKNGSFEDASDTSRTDWRFACASWSFSRLGSRSPTADGGGQNNGSAVSTSTAYRTPYGCTTAYLRTQYQMSQTVSVPADGEYVLSFVHSQRDYYQDPGYKNPISVKIDGSEVVSIPARAAKIPFTRVTTAPIRLTAGSHALVFQNLGAVNTNTSQDGAMVFIDDVSLSRKTIDLAFADGARIDLVTGSVVRLENAEDLALPSGAVTVNGEPFNGRKTNLRGKGVVVEGTGKIQVGPPLGLTILVR